jgi:hypothetical protein
MIRTYLVTVDAVDDPDATPSDQLDEAMALHRAIGQTLSASTFHTFRGRGVRFVSVRPAVHDNRRGGDNFVVSGAGGWVSDGAGTDDTPELRQVTP